MKKRSQKIPIETDLTRLFLPFCFLEGIKVHNYYVKYPGTDLYTQFIPLSMWVCYHQYRQAENAHGHMQYAYNLCE